MGFDRRITSVKVNNPFQPMINLLTPVKDLNNGNQIPQGIA